MLRLIFVLSLVFVSVALAQTDRGRMTGTIYDSSGAVVPKANVTATNQSTGVSRQVAADEKGHYRIDDLLPASYKLAAAAPGFAEAVAEAVPLDTGQERTLDLHLHPEGVTETVSVVAAAPSQVDTSSADIASTVSSREVASLPLNGRELSQLYLLIPGASSAGQGTFDDIRFAGRSNEQNVIRYDGIEAGTIIDSSATDINGASGGASSFRLAQSLENVQEFRVESSNYNAEYGRGTGGQVTVITKSGSNGFHGSLFENVRNSWLDARNYFDHGVTPAPLRLNQFGGSFGGPIIKDRLFFFFSQEDLLQRLAVPFNETVPSSFAWSQAVPAMLPLRAIYPVGYQATTSPYFSLATGTQSSFVNEYFGSSRFDYRINDKNNAYFRYTRDQGYASIPKQLDGSAQVLTDVPQNAIADLTTIVTPNLVNDLKIGFNASKGRYITQGASAPGLNLSNTTFTFSGAGNYGGTGIDTPSGAGSSPLSHSQIYTNYEMEYIDNLSWTHGAHSVKAGIEINPRTMYMDQTGGIVYTFATIQTFLADQPSQVQLASDLADSPSPFHNGVTGVREGLQTFYGGFIQDEWRIRPNLTMNYGLRYDYFTVLREARHLEVNMNPVTGQLELGQPPYTTSPKNFGPRVAFTWAPEALNNKTVFRAGSGLYYGPGQEEDQVQSILNDTANETLTTGNIAYPLNRPQLLAQWDPTSPNASFQPRAYGQGYSIPEHVLSYTFSWQQTLPDQSVLTVAYVGSEARNLFQRTIANLITGVTTDPNTGVAIIQRQFGTQYAEIDVKTSHGTANYNSLQVNWNRRFAKGLTAVANYTWAHNMGTSDGSNEAITSEDNYNFSSEYGSNTDDIRQTVNSGVLWNVPVGSSTRLNFGGNRWLNGMFGGWQVGGNFNARTGLPINVLMTRPNVLYYDPQNGQYYSNPVNGVTTAVLNLPGGGQSRGTQRPNLIPGVDPYVQTSTGFYLNPAAFSVPAPGTYGNLARNALVGPGFVQLDMTFSKHFTVTEKLGGELRADLYNIFNHPNLANPPSLLSSPSPSGPGGSGLQPGQAFTAATAGSSFGLLNATVGQYVAMGTARQLQLTLRFVF